MYDLRQLLDDAARKWGGPSGASSARSSSSRSGWGLDEVWKAFNRYVTDIMEKRQVLHVPNFCKIGWRLEEQLQSKVKLRPHFQVLESFARAHNIDLKSHSLLPDKLLAVIEEFNFSKAAIRFSQNLTKDHFFMGLRAIILQLGEVIASGQQFSIEFEVGKLVGSERALHFAFTAELYIQEGLEVPSGAVESSDYRPSASFAPPTKEAMSMSVTGTGNFGNAGHVRAVGMGGWHDPGTCADAEVDPGNLSPVVASEVTLPGLEQVSSSVLEMAHEEARNRYIAKLASEAEEAITYKEQFETHLKRCEEEENKDSAWRRALAKDYSDQLQIQMRMAEERRVSGRQHSIEQASAHDFPNFKESPEMAVYEYIRERRNNLKEDLDQQVNTKLQLKLAVKERERELELTHVAAGQKELAALKKETMAKKKQERSILSDAWNADKKLRSARKAIDEHHKSPTTRSGLSDMLNSTLGSGPHLELGGNMSPRTDASGPPSSRSINGSVRRMPIGAAASLALHKEKLAAMKR